MRIQTLPYADLLVHGDEGLVLRADETHHSGRQGRGQSPSSHPAPQHGPAEAVPSSAEEPGGTIARLSAIGVAVLQLAADGIDLVSLAAALEARFGAPPDHPTVEAVHRVLAVLAAEGLVRLDHESDGGAA